MSQEKTVSQIEKLQATYASLAGQYAQVMQQLRALEKNERELSGALGIVGAQLNEARGTTPPSANE